MVFKSFGGEKLQLVAELSHTNISRVRLEYKELCTSTDELKETKTRNVSVPTHPWGPGYATDCIIVRF